LAFDPISAALDIGGKLIDRLWPDPQQAAAAKLELFKMQQAGELATLTADSVSDAAQASIDQVEAANANKFVSYWRPTLGWVCVGGFAYLVVVTPVANLVASLLGFTIVMPAAPPELNYVLTGLLGLSHVSRSVEKVYGVAKK
jgi:hypothetical protein